MKATPGSLEKVPHIHAGDAPVVLHPESNDIFVSTGKQIIQACELSIGLNVWLEELKEMLAEVGTWCAQRADKVSACWAEGRGSKILLLFVPSGQKFNFDLAAELAVLNRKLVTEFNIGMVEVGQIPQSDLTRFMDLEKARVVYGQPREEPHPVAAQS